MKKQARVACHPSYRGAPLRKCSKGYFRALSAWREGALGASPIPRRAFAARSLLSCTAGGAGGIPGPPPQNLFQETNTLTSFIYKNCTVGEVTGMSDLSFGFNILNERRQAILSLSFRTRDDAAQSRAEIAKAIAKAVEVTRPALTAAGEP